MAASCFLRLSAAAVADGEVVAGVGGKDFGCEAEAFGEGLRGEERVLALAEFGVVEVYGERELIDGDGVGEGCFDVFGLGFLVDAGLAGGGGGEGEVAGFPCVLTGFAADVGKRLGPDEVGEGCGGRRRFQRRRGRR